MGKEPAPGIMNDCSHGAPVIEASWAPTDPRDKLYDVSATSGQKFGSIFRVLGSFHPVLNVFILLADSVRRIGIFKSLLVWAVGLALFYILLVWLMPHI